MLMVVRKERGGHSSFPVFCQHLSDKRLFTGNRPCEIQSPESEMQSSWSSVAQKGAGMSCDQTEDYTLVFFDLETTGLGNRMQV
ncbi:uncharacterized protein LOC121299273 isoform X3 [Polyodon spathula]|uniref:uncharacterized protein LOC121299273 isoform X3 n=1 Tax=Polyodon spathula TaxID=7913 RepID=UPI001B7F0BC5|nr:uncharacterized protein LOC121299273 isoform X3 [Polyodon spathula]